MGNLLFDCFDPSEAVLTTQSVMSGAKVSHIFYDESCYDEESIVWEFYPDEDWSFDDLRLVAMEEVLGKDPSLKDVMLRISKGECAYYDTSSDKWIIAPYPYEERDSL